MDDLLTGYNISRRLCEAGICGDHEKEWVQDSDEGGWVVRSSDFYDLFDGPAYCAGAPSWPAYTEEELLKMLPEEIRKEALAAQKKGVYENRKKDIRTESDCRLELLALILMAEN